MSSSQGGKRSSDVEIGEATTPALIPTFPVEAPACVADHLSFREKLTRRKAEKEPVRAGTEYFGSPRRIVHDSDKERAAESMPPHPVRKEIVLALRAPSAVPVGQPKSWKRKFTKGGDGESLQQGGSSIASGLRGKYMSLIDGMISECGSEASHLAGEFSELQGELERDIGKMASSLLKEKKARKARSSEKTQRGNIPWSEKTGGDAAPGLDEATGEEGV
uniref:Uncharacterized protein n=1 Tax=Brassica campestris TaxID=3711 RepID=M4F796_BRACM